MPWARKKYQIEIMNIRNLSERVAKRLNLQFLVEPEKRMYHLFLEKLLFDQQKKETPDNLADIRIKPISVKTNAKQEEYKILFQNGKSFILRNEDDKEVGKGEIGKPFECDSLSFIIEGLSQEEKSLRFRLVSLSAAGKKILESLNISPLKDTNIIKIEVNWNDATIAKEIAEAILEEYKQFSIDKRTREASQVLSFIESELGRQKNELLQVEAKLEKYKKEKGIIALDVNAQNALTQMAQYEREYRAIENYRKQAEIVLAELQKADPFTEKEALLSLGAGLNNPLLIDLGKELGKLNAEKSALNSVLKKEHPKIRQADREIQSVKRSIISELRSLISTIKTSEETSKASLTKKIATAGGTFWATCR